MGTFTDLNDPLNLAAPLRQMKLSEQIYDRIFALIVSGEFPENSKLPTEVELAGRFGVSRTVVREALARLRDDGVVMSRQGAGTFVQRQPDQAILGFRPMASISDILRCFEFRVGLEGEAAFVAATRQDAPRIEDIARALEALEAIVKQGSVGAIADYDFHLAVANASCNPFFVSVMESLRRNIDFGMNLARNLSLRKPVSRVRQVQEEHAQVYDAIKRGDAEAARKAMRQHIENARTRIFEGENV
jgi:GntR family transcriptional regulator, transcriptional repressor for pyruvate dehydrogenase complex